MASGQVFLPLEKFDQCSVCGRSDGLRLCSACSEEIYCSKECQKQAWREHKLRCGPTVKLDLNTFYPFIATLIELARSKQPPHLAFKHQVLGQPEANQPIPFADGTSVRPVVLGPKSEGNWWPGAPSKALKLRLEARIKREGYILPNLVAVLTGLLARVYTTTSVKASDSPNGKPQKRIRLHYRGSPVSDFGIAKGAVEVPEGSELAYHDPSTGKTFKVQNSQDHYWIYFRTLKGEECILDCGLYPFGLFFVVFNDFYTTRLGRQLDELIKDSDACPAPGLFIGKEMRKSPVKHEAKEHFSVLRSETLADAVRLFYTAKEDTPAIAHNIEAFAKNVAGRELTTVEAKLLNQWTLQDIPLFDQLLSEESWADWPEHPRIDFYNFVHANDYKTGYHLKGEEGQEEEEDFAAFLVNWNRRYRRGAISYEEWVDGCHIWRAKRDDFEDDIDEDEDDTTRVYNISTNPVVQWVD